MNSIGDLARTLVLRNQQSHLKTNLTRLTQELTSGQTADLRAKLDGRTGQVVAIDHDLAITRQYLASGIEAQGLLGHQQIALDQISTVLSDNLHPVLALQSTATRPNLTALSATARQGLEQVFSSLKQTHAGKPVFAGANQLGSIDDLLGELTQVLAAKPAHQSRDEVLSEFFDGPYVSRFGAQELPQQVFLGRSDHMTLDTTPTSDSVRQSLKALADLALLAQAPNGADDLPSVATGLGVAQDRLTATQADVGAKEHRLEALQSAHRARINALEQSRNGLISADPFDTATRLEETRFQLEALFSVTARLSRLSLTEYL